MLSLQKTGQAAGRSRWTLRVLLQFLFLHDQLKTIQKGNEVEMDEVLWPLEPSQVFRMFVLSFRVNCLNIVMMNFGYTVFYSRTAKGNWKKEVFVGTGILFWLVKFRLFKNSNKRSPLGSGLWSSFSTNHWLDIPYTRPFLFKKHNFLAAKVICLRSSKPERRQMTYL